MPASIATPAETDTLTLTRREVKALLDTGRHRRTHPASETVPVAPLVLMAAAGFITMLTEALPVGVMPALQEDLGWSAGTVGQLVTSYAVGCGLAAIPMALLTRSLGRKPLLLATLAAFVVTNTVTMLTSHLLVMTVARFAAGACAGLLWAMLAGYATRLVVPGIAGRAMAIAMAGTPVALALGIPLGSFLGALMGWRLAFLAVSGLAALVLLLASRLLPWVEGEPAVAGRPGVPQVVRFPGMARVLLVTAGFATAHNVVYTFVPVLVRDRSDVRLDLLLLAFGLVAVVGLTLVGRLVDGHLETLARVECATLALALIATSLLPHAHPVTAWVVVGLWGLVFGGAPTVFQTASARICGQSQEIGQALVVTSWNLCVALAGALGGLLVDGGYATGLPLVGAALAVGALAVAIRLRATPAS